MGKSTISMAIFNSFLYVHQRVNLHVPMVFLWFSYGFPIKTSIFRWFSLKQIMISASPFHHLHQDAARAAPAPSAAPAAAASAAPAALDNDWAVRRSCRSLANRLRSLGTWRWKWHTLWKTIGTWENHRENHRKMEVYLLVMSK